MTHLPEVLAWVLLHFVWQATVIVLLYKSAERVAADRPVARYNLALAALLCMLGSSILTFFYEEAHIGAAVSGESAFGTALLAASLHGTGVVALLLTAVHTETAQIIRFIDVAWLAGVLLFFLRALGGAWILARIRRASSSASGAELAQRFFQVARRFDLDRRVTLRIHTATISPFVVGLFRSVIYLPASVLTSLTPEQIDSILAHELAHVRRADYIWNLAQVVMETLFFFHPAVWWIGKTLREQRELCCDDIALQCGESPTTYAKALLTLAENRQAHPRFAMPMQGQHSRKHLLSRISRILGETCTPTETTTPAATLRLAMSISIGVLVLCCSMAMTPTGSVRAFQAAFLNQPEAATLSQAPNTVSHAGIRKRAAVSSRPMPPPADTPTFHNRYAKRDLPEIQPAPAPRLAQLPENPRTARLSPSEVAANPLAAGVKPNPSPYRGNQSPHPHSGNEWISPRPHPK